jgi:hypothetical protein
MMQLSTLPEVKLPEGFRAKNAAMEANEVCNLL